MLMPVGCSCWIGDGECEGDSAPFFWSELLSVVVTDGQTNDIHFIQFVCLSRNLVELTRFRYGIRLSVVHQYWWLPTDRRIEHIFTIASVCS